MRRRLCLVGLILEIEQGSPTEMFSGQRERWFREIDTRDKKI